MTPKATRHRSVCATEGVKTPNASRAPSPARTKNPPLPPDETRQNQPKPATPARGHGRNLPNASVRAVRAAVCRRCEGWLALLRYWDILGYLGNAHRPLFSIQILRFRLPFWMWERTFPSSSVIISAISLYDLSS